MTETLDLGALEPHEFAAMIPDMNEEQYTQLVEDIGEHGMAIPVTLFEGRILDGRHRHKAWLELKERGHNVKPLAVCEFPGDRKSAYAYVLSMNLHRRQLEYTQRVALATLWKRSLQASGEIKRGRPEKESEIGRVSADAAQQAADKFDVGRNAVYEAEEILEAAPDLFEQMMEGNRDIDLRAAQKEVRRRKKQEAIAVKLADLPPAITDRYSLHHSGVADLAEHIEPETVNAIITDPPYPKEYLHLYGDLGEFAAKVLKPGGSLLAMCGQTYLPDVLSLLLPHLSYYWTLGYLTPGDSPHLWHRQVNTNWKPVLWLVKGEYQGETVADVVKSDANDKRFHEWGQSEGGFAEIVERFTSPGDLVVDPFLGGGTTAVVSLRLDRRFIGGDVDAGNLDTTRARLAEVG